MFGKTEETPPFQTWQQIEKQIERGGLNEDQQADLWSCLYLSSQEIKQLLTHIRKTTKHAWLYPMVVMAAHTGARRSEMLRSEVTDFDGDEVVIRERKRSQSTHTTRRVPISNTLRTAVDEWLQQHPGGQFTFCQGRVYRSKKRRDVPEPITRNEANDHFRRTLRGSKWERVPGWHCLRHSFISNLASQGVDQRMIDEFVGHSTDAMRRRYRHLFPDMKAAELKRVFR